MPILHFISHTHWDREWHEPFQVFRIRLAETIDRALDLLAQDPEYKYFMLDGQTVVLEDYLEMVPGRAAELRACIERGRILVGPWYVLPDEFLVSGEALIRNLQRGLRMANRFGKSMRVGYIPDPFGHISQMPQILAGFGIHYALFRRGLADEPTELWWEGADGTRILTTYLRDGYDNAAWLPRDPQTFTTGLRRLVGSLEPHAVTEHLLMMHGTDHMQPWAGLPERMRDAQAEMPGTTIIHSNLPDYAQAVEQALSEEQRAELCVVRGELRNPKRHHLLPGVASTRMWIKQRNAHAQTLLEQWAEPLAAAAMSFARSASGVGEACSATPALRPELELAWKYLLQNHPHDSICGCSIDQVHAEMGPRFDWAEQIAGDVVTRALDAIIPAINTRSAAERECVALVVFNSAPETRGQPVTAEFDLPEQWESYELVDAAGRVVPVIELDSRVEEHARVTATVEDLRWTLGAAQSGQVEGHKLRALDWHVEGDQVHLDVTVSDQGEPDRAHIRDRLAALGRLTSDPTLKLFHLRLHSLRKVRFSFFADGTPGHGFKTFWLHPASRHREITPVPETEGVIIENESLRVEANGEDGTLTITDKTTGAVFAGANRFVDGGDRGDLYNYCPPEHDLFVSSPAEPPRILRLDFAPVRQELHIDTVLRVPASLAADRVERSAKWAELPITTVVTLHAGARRIDFHTRVDNRASDHRLRVEFPTPIHTGQSLADQAFDLVARSIALPRADASWVEQPIPALPMQKFVTVRDAEAGLLLAARGLPEYEVKTVDQTEKEAAGGERPGQNGVTIALTLLRCIGWLSRPDLANRRGDAGPEKQTPGAQEQGTHEFDYALIPYAPSFVPAPEGGMDGEEQPLTWREARAEALAFAAPPRAAATDPHSGLLPPELSWMEAGPADFIVTALKPAEEGSGLILRGYNGGDLPLEARIRPFRAFSRAARANLNESPVEALAPDAAGAVTLDLRPREILTLRFED